MSWLSKGWIPAFFVGFVAVSTSADEYLNGIKWQEPAKVKPATSPGGPPSDAVILFDGTNLDAWEKNENWKIEDGALVSGRGDALTKDSFGDCQFHIEWSSHVPPTGQGQGRGNSGLFFMNNYEMQILDSYNNDTYFDGQAGGIYKQTPPQVNAMRPPGEWNVYDVVWTAPRFHADGSLASPAAITALHNGVLILNHFELKGDTPFHRPPQYNRHADRLPFRLQDHGNPVRFRNIWVREIKTDRGEQVRPPFLRNDQGEETPIKK